MNHLNYFGRLFAFITAITALSISCGKAEAPEPVGCWYCEMITRIGPIPDYYRDSTLCNATEAQARQFEKDFRDTVITYRESTEGHAMRVEYITDVDCVLKSITP